MMHEDKLSQLVPDINDLLMRLNKGEVIYDKIEPHVDRLLSNIKESIKHWATPEEREGGLRMSNIGKKDRQLWYEARSDTNKLSHEAPNVQLRFLYGHIVEEMLLMLVRAAGHVVTDEQAEVEVDGIVGHIDAVIDDEVVDVKSASSFSFLKIANGTLAADDPFGYLAQLSGYEEKYGKGNGGFLVLNKENGLLVLYRPDDLDKVNVPNRIKYIKEVITLDNRPEKCYNDKPEGKSGNMVLHKNCVYCPFKEDCHSDTNDGKGLRKFQYANGIKYFTHIEKEPTVEEVR